MTEGQAAAAWEITDGLNFSIFSAVDTGYNELYLFLTAYQLENMKE
jgi:hypothetical protein